MMTLCRLRVVQANSHSISITHLVVFVKYMSCIFSVAKVLPQTDFPLVRRLCPTSSCYLSGGIKDKVSRCHYVHAIKKPTEVGSNDRGFPLWLGSELSKDFLQEPDLIDQINLIFDCFADFCKLGLGVLLSFFCSAF